MRFVFFCLVVGSFHLGGCASMPSKVGDEASLRAVDEQQRSAVAANDMRALEALAHASLRINAPTGKILTRATFLSSMTSGAIAAEHFERKPENVSISGNLGIVMGQEMFTPTETSELGKTYGATPLLRRYTNVYVWEGGSWKWLVRHANVVPQQRQARTMDDSGGAR